MRHNPAMLWSELWEGKTMRDRIVRGFLTPFSWLYALGWQAYRGMYRVGLKKPAEPHSPVVCIGNLVTGGSGKSPMTLFVAEALKELGYAVVVSCSGYGSPASEAARLAPEGELSAKEWGDEPAMIRWLASDIPLIVGRRRVLAAEICQQHFPEAVLLMDDGFQHLPLKKHVTILLDPPGKNRRCIPAGPYREPYGNKALADLVLPGDFELRRVFGGLQRPDGTVVELEGLREREVSYLCALADPTGFVQTLRAQGLKLGAGLTLPDHDPLNKGNLLESFPKDNPLIVTAKDWVKLRERADVGCREVLIVKHQVEVEPRKKFVEWLKTRLS